MRAAMIAIVEVLEMALPVLGCLLLVLAVPAADLAPHLMPWFVIGAVLVLLTLTPAALIVRAMLGNGDAEGA